MSRSDQSASGCHEDDAVWAKFPADAAFGPLQLLNVTSCFPGAIYWQYLQFTGWCKKKLQYWDNKRKAAVEVMSRDV